MTRPGAAALFALAFVAGLNAGGQSPAVAQPAGELYSAKDGRYSVRFPGKPKEAPQTAKSPLGELTVFTATYVTSEGNVYLTSYTDFPEGTARKETRDALLDGVREGLKGKDAEVLSEEKVKNLPDGTVGRDLELKKGNQRVRVRVVLRDNRLYQVAAVGTPAFTTGKTVNGFIESFELAK